MMTPDQLFARWVRVFLVIFAVLFVYFILADLWLPMTPQSRLLKPVVKVSPQVSGQVVRVIVKDDQKVHAGDILFEINPQPYQLAVDKAQLAVQQAIRQNQQLDLAIQVVQANLQAADSHRTELQVEYKRAQTLLRQNMMSTQQFEQLRAKLQAATATVKATRANVAQLIAQRGASGEQNILLRQAKNALASAQLKLSYCQVRADVDGTISNLQLQPGVYAQAGAPVAALVSKQTDIVAYFREKSLLHVKVGERADVVFDGLPGQVFTGHVMAMDAGIKDGQVDINGNLAAIDQTTRWVRSAQRQRLHIQLDQPDVLRTLPSGARSTVQLYPRPGVVHWLGLLQIRFVSLIHYIY